MEEKNSVIDLNKSAILSKFEELNGLIKIKDVQIEQFGNLIEKLNNQIATQNSYIKKLEEQHKILRLELKKERQQSESKIEKDVFFEELARLMKNIETDKKSVSENWKDLLDAVVKEVENCIQLIENKQGYSSILED